MALIVILGILSILNQSIGVKLPGSCPENVPDTHHTEHERISILFVITQFSKNIQSYLFRQNSNESYFCFDVYINEDRITLHPLTNTQYYRSSDVLQNNKTLVLDTYLVKKGGKAIDCHPHIKETVRIWKQDNLFIVWSCQEVEPGKSHEEAIIISQSYTNIEFHKSRESVEKAMNFIKPIVANYVSAALMEAIEWPREYSDCVIAAPLPCPVKRGSGLVFPSIFVIIVIAIGVALFLTQIWQIVKPDNRVGVVAPNQIAEIGG